jgi:hypothetical protein
MTTLGSQNIWTSEMDAVRLIPTNDLVAIQIIEQDGITWASTNCRDYDVFAALPQTVMLNGKRLGKSGWNSDRGIAYYKSNSTFLIPIPSTRGAR